MNELVLTILISPVLVAASKGLLDLGQRLLAAHRVAEDPLYDVGSVLARILEGDREVIGRCRVHEIRTGRIEVRSIDGRGNPSGIAMSWTVREFVKRFDPQAEL